MEIPSYVVELLEKEREENSEFRDEIRKDFAAMREWMAVHQAQHAASKQFWQYVGAVFATLLTIAGIIAPLIWRH